jgi:MFS family permease
MGANAGTVAGPLVTALLLFVFDWRLVTAILAVPAVVVAIAGVLVDIDETRATEPSEEVTVPTDREQVGGIVPAIVSDSRFLFASGFAVVLLVVVFNGLFYRGLLTFLPGILGDIATEQASSSSVLIPDDELLARINIGNYLFSGILVLGMGGQYLGGRITDYIPPERGLTATLGLLAITSMFAPTALSMGLTPMLVVATVLGFLLFALQPFAQVTIAEYSAPELRGLSFGYTYFLVFGVGSFSAAMIGYVLTYSTVSVAFVVLAVIAASGSTTSFLLLQRREPGPLLSESPSTD